MNVSKWNNGISRFLWYFLYSIGFLFLFSTGYAQDIIRFGCMSSAFSGVDKRDAQVALKMMLDKVVAKITDNKKYTHKFEAIAFDDLESIVQAFQSHRIHFMNLNSFDYLAIRDQLPQLEPVLIVTPEEHPTTKFVLLVRNGGTIQNLGQLREKKLTIPNNMDGKMGMIWLNTLLVSNDLPASKSFFSTIKVMDKVSQVVLPVFFDQTDACIVSRFAFETMVEMNPQIQKQVAVLFESDAYVKDMICLDKNVNENLKNDIIQSACSLHSDPEGRQMLLLFRAKKLVPFDPTLLGNNEKLYRRFVEISNEKVVTFDDLVEKN